MVKERFSGGILSLEPAHCSMFKKDNTLNNHDMSGDAETIIGPSVKIEGDFQGEGNIMIAGSLSGTLKTAQKVRVDEKAKIVADLEAEDAIIAGEIEGNMVIHNSLEILATAKITGDITTNKLTIEQGAQINGRCSMQEMGKLTETEDTEEQPASQENQDSETPAQSKEEIKDDWLQEQTPEQDSEN